MNSETKIQHYNKQLRLLDVYGSLLSKKKFAYITAHFYEDLSLSEIASSFAVSRAAVHEAINEGMKELEDYESKLKIIQNQEKRINFIKNNISDKDIIKKYIELEYQQDK